MTIDQLLVSLGGIGLIIFIYWFFFGASQKESDTTVIYVDGGYKPSVIKVKSNAITNLTFIRKDSNSCLEEIVFPDFQKKEYLPLHTPVVISIHPEHPGLYNFHCGMNMFHGSIKAV